MAVTSSVRLLGKSRRCVSEARTAWARLLSSCHEPRLSPSALLFAPSTRFSFTRTTTTTTTLGCSYYTTASYEAGLGGRTVSSLLGMMEDRGNQGRIDFGFGLGRFSPARLYTSVADKERKGAGEGEEASVSGSSEPTSKIAMIQKYGVTFMMCWGTLYAVPLAGIYGALSTGLVGGADAIQILKHAGLDKLGIDITLINPTFGNVALSYGINEVLEVVRLPLAIAVTPVVAKLLGRRAAQSSQGSGESGAGEKPLGKLALQAKTNQKLEMIKQYGFTFLGWWTLLWAISWGGLYVALDNGLMGGQDGIELLSKIPYVDNFVDVEKLNLGENSKEWGNLGVSFVMNELLEIGRFPIAVATTPVVAKALGLRKKSD
ncbi:hypothetical protein A3770_07p48430 [Chloropicon primus]|uniref:DUF1279 domain-containing protein n=2 Tax=Chloropicon primus TaxID=1764295 RepID=A0A5B8MRP8_9CHLO|nr:hypothetical protein A3770_07p48430 [Chloropicon primus]|eukprot:QDZ22325.1 hypothetical protein A3770_07p48430 [Chloropicon primus]